MSAQIPVAIWKTQQSLDLHVIWSLHNHCNYDCPYCPDANSDGSQKWITLDVARAFIDNLYRHYRMDLGYEKIQISFTGGEPTLWKPFRELCNYIHERGISLGMTTNATPAPSYWEPIAHLFEWICFSYHPQFVKDERFFANLRYFHDRADAPLPAVRFMMRARESYWQQCLDLAAKMRRELDNYAYEFVEIQPDFGKNIELEDYSEAQKEFLAQARFTEVKERPELVRRAEHFLDHMVRYDDGTQERLRPNDLVNRKQTNFRGWDCHVGLECIYIDFPGSIYRGGCREGGRIGRMQEPDRIRFPSAPLRCRMPACTCPTNVMISKFDPNYKKNDQNVVAAGAAESVALA